MDWTLSVAAPSDAIGRGVSLDLKFFHAVNQKGLGYTKGAFMKSLYNRLLLLLAVSVVPVAFGEDAGRNPPELIPFQGFLVDGNGNPLGRDKPENHRLVIRIFDAADGGNNLWAEQQTVSVDQGRFEMLMGVGEPYEKENHGPLSEIFRGPNAGERHVSVERRESLGETGPRTRLISQPYALLARSANSLVSASGRPMMEVEDGGLSFPTPVKIGTDLSVERDMAVANNMTVGRDLKVPYQALLNWLDVTNRVMSYDWFEIRSASRESYPGSGMWFLKGTDADGKSSYLQSHQGRLKLQTALDAIELNRRLIVTTGGASIGGLLSVDADGLRQPDGTWNLLRLRRSINGASFTVGFNPRQLVFDGNRAVLMKTNLTLTGMLGVGVARPVAGIHIQADSLVGKAATKGGAISLLRSDADKGKSRWTVLHSARSHRLIFEHNGKEIVSLGPNVGDQWVSPSARLQAENRKLKGDVAQLQQRVAALESSLQRVIELTEKMAGTKEN